MSLDCVPLLLSSLENFRSDVLGCDECHGTSSVLVLGCEYINLSLHSLSRPSNHAI